MKTFQEYMKEKINEELWNTAGPQDNPSNPGTKRKNARAWLNKRYGSQMGQGIQGVTAGQAQPQVKEGRGN